MKECPKCKGEMTQGILLDKNSSPLTGRRDEPTIWTVEVPEFDWQGRFKNPTMMFQVAAYRCAKCRYVELYA